MTWRVAVRHADAYCGRAPCGPKSNRTLTPASGP
jgi:hypothetical protein